ncbi:MAG: phosphoenolpyruvate--protein phosphotransferase [Mycoplasmatales bacterium]
MKNHMKGIAVSKGIAIAKVFKLEPVNLKFEKNTNINKEEEVNKLTSSTTITLDQIEDIKQIAIKKIGEAEGEVFEAHKMILQDPELLDQIKAKIENDNIDCASATLEVTDLFIEQFNAIEDEYFKARAADVKDVRVRLLANILGRTIPDLNTINEKVIIIAEDLTPSETSQLNKEFTLGFITNIGGRTSHSAIMARTLEIPAIVGTGNILESVKNGDLVILDGSKGDIYINPDQETIDQYKQEQLQFEENLKLLEDYKTKESISLDNHKVEIGANIGTPNDLDLVLENGAEGIGLYRTEFLYMESNELPSEEIQFEAYKKVLESMGDRPVVVRTLDIGGDKELSYLKFPEELNPFLGYRAIRMCLDRPDIFKVQLRALLRASVYGNLKIMFPMIATVEEFRDAKALLLETKEELLKEGIEVKDIEVGIMVEIPSTATMADTFAKEVDFFSIGTNDLIQYTMACDRMSDKVSYLYQPYNPAILRMVKNVIDASHKEGKWTGMCGEMASDDIAIPLLLAMGLDEFSMSASAILDARLQISKLSKEELETHLDKVLNLSTADDVQEYVLDLRKGE